MRSNSLRAQVTSLATAALILVGSLSVFAQGMFDAKPVKLPWKIAFTRDKNIWVMNADGSGQKAWRSLGNVHTRLTWSPDGEQLAWARQGEYTYKLPDGGGGGRRLYDVFRAEVDSSREAYWRWVTFNHGSRSPDWSPDGQKLLYVNDINSNIVDAELPDYQIEYSNLDGTNPVRLTRQGAKPGECQGVDPTWSPDGKQVAFIYHKRNDKVGEGSQRAPNTPIGLVVAPITGITVTEAELEAQAKKVPNAAYPSWSPDGKWIAFMNPLTADGGIYVASPDGATKKTVFEKTDRLIPMQGHVSWSPDSKWIAFSSTDGFIYVLDMAGSGKPQRITSGGNDYHPAFSRK